MLSILLPWIIGAFLFTLIICMVYKPEWLIAWVPIAIVTYTIISTCVIGIPVGHFGYDQHHIYPAGYEAFKWPWHHITIVKHDYEDIELVFQVRTSDRYALEYTFEIQDHRWDPTIFVSKYQANTSNYINQETKRLQPYVDQVMSHVSAREFHFHGGTVANEIRSQLVPRLNLNGLTYNPKRYTTDNYRYVDWFSGGADMGKISMMYICDEFAGLCTAADAVGIPKGPTYYAPSAEYTPDPTPTPEPTPIYMYDSGVETQEEVNAMLDDIIANPSKYGM